MNYIYAVQWIDHGGPYHEPFWQDQVPTALEQMGFDPNEIIVNMGGLSLHQTFASEPVLFGYIETNVKLPKWDGMVKPSPRWVEQIVLWFYTFEPKEEDIVERFSLSDFECVFYNLE